MSLYVILTTPEGVSPQQMVLELSMVCDEGGKVFRVSFLVGIEQALKAHTNDPKNRPYKESCVIKVARCSMSLPQRG